MARQGGVQTASTPGASLFTVLWVTGTLRSAIPHKPIRGSHMGPPLVHPNARQADLQQLQWWAERAGRLSTKPAQIKRTPRTAEALPSVGAEATWRLVQSTRPLASSAQGAEAQSLEVSSPQALVAPQWTGADADKPLQPPSSPVTRSLQTPPCPAGGSLGTSGQSHPCSSGSSRQGAARRAGRAPLSARPTQLVRNNMLL